MLVGCTPINGEKSEEELGRVITEVFSTSVTSGVSKVSSAEVEARYYLKVILGERMFTALFDPEAQNSLLGARAAELFRDRLRPSSYVSENANYEIEPVLGTVRVMLEVGHVTKPIVFRVVKNLSDEVLLGIDFAKLFNLDTRFGKGMWRTEEGEWYRFENEKRVPTLYGECAGMKLITEGKLKRVDQLVRRIFSETEGKLGVTPLTEHSIDVQGTAPIRYRLVRMSPKMLEMAIQEMQR